VLAGVATQSTGILAWLCWAGFALTVGVMIGLGLCDTWAPWSDVDEPGREPRPRP
jgi:hypothetical protein